MTRSAVVGLSDDHLHSIAGSEDARATVLEMCAAADALGLRSLCFTEHIDFDRDLPEYGYYQRDRVLREIDAARARFGDGLEIRTGLEIDFEPRLAAEVAGIAREMPVDFVLGAVHSFQGVHYAHMAAAGAALAPDELSRIYRRYFAEVRELIELGAVDCLAHLDYPGRAGLRARDGSPVPGHADELEATLALAAMRGVGVEINTRGRRAGLPPQASEAAVRRYIALGGEVVTLGSDAHRPEQLGEGLEAGRAALRRAGRDYQTVFRGRRAARHFFDG